jgi:ATP-dependent helicase Lhr and Lhr-like helicase
MTKPRLSEGAGKMEGMGNPLGGFAEPTRQWFTAAFAEPTPAQNGAWDAIRAGHHALVIAPTGSGKTLAAFLAALDRLAFGPPPAEPKQRCRVVYLSPLKALGVDVERNLRAPLAGLRQAAVRCGLPEPEVRIAVRSGDTPATDRRKFVSHPPDILITTPESLFLLLTSQAREALRGVETVIVDEVHAVVGTKRGAHLAVSLERLDAILPRPAQRIGLSATVRPPQDVARWLSGHNPGEPRPATIVAPPSTKVFDLKVVVPVEDLTELGQGDDGRADESVPAEDRGRRATSIWPHVEARVVELIEQHTSTLVFVNSRRVAERLCNRLNELHYAKLDPLLDPALDLALDGRPATAPARPNPFRPPAELMGEAGSVSGAPPVLARAHHGSVSKEQRAEVEEALKAGRLPAVVATSSLELGIDMGAVDLVVQVESPPSVASGLQRIGRAGHQVGAVSRGVIFPKFRGDLVQAAVVAERMRAGQIEALAPIRNPLDVLAQQIVAMVALDDWHSSELLALVRRSAPFHTLTDGVYEAVLDMLAGRYPSDEFAELKPRIVWDRDSGMLGARPGTQHLAVTSGGTIPDRGLFGVFLIGGGTDAQRGGRRVGELDEEMVYESRVGDVFTLGTSSWRIEEITQDKVLVSPAPGQPGRLPFWHGDTLGRPLELGRAIGAFTRELAALDRPGATERLRAAGLDAWAAGNLVAYLDEQREATGQVPDDRTIVVERFHDELGDWRLVVHSPFGAQVHAPWALAIGARLKEQYGLDAQVMHGDDGIVLRLPDTSWESDLGSFDADSVDERRAGELSPSADLARFAADEIEQTVTDEIGGSALFAARFRECAARALLLPRRRPGRRVPLWQQRQRAAQLLSVASKFASFPIVLETVRECLQDVFDVPGLVTLLGDIEARRVRIVEVETPAPSPFAKSLLFGYVAQFMYEGDSPLAERRAAALSVDPSLLAELLGRPELRDLFDLDTIEELEAQLQHLSPDRVCRDAEDAADLLRLLGPLSTEQAALRGVAEDWLAGLEQKRRVIRVRIAGEERWAAIEDAGRLRDALGCPLPVGVPEVFTEPVGDPLGDLVSRYARTHAPFAAETAAAHFGLGAAVVRGVLEGLEAQRRVVRGALRPDESGEQWCDARVLRRLRARTVAALREQTEPTGPEALALLVPAWQSVGQAPAGAGRHRDRRMRGVDGVLRAVEQLAGVAVPASALERLILPARVSDYQPSMLDELTAGGEVCWAGAGALAVDDGWIALAPAAIAPLVLPEPTPVLADSPIHAAILKSIDGEVGIFFRTLAAHCADLTTADSTTADSTGADPAAVLRALWDLVWAGLVTNDTFAPVRALLRSGRTAHKAKPATPRGRYAAARFTGLAPGGAAGAAAPVPLSLLSGPLGATAVGRWSRLRDAGTPGVADPRAVAAAAQVTGEVLLDRYGIVTRGAVGAERLPGGFGAAYRVLSAFEEVGKCRRGYFVEGLGGAQFAAPGAVDRLRAFAAPDGETSPEAVWATADRSQSSAQFPSPSSSPGDGRRVPGVLLLAAADPANVYGAAVSWPVRRDSEADGVLGAGAARTGHKPGRKAGSLVLLADGELALYVERGGRTVLSWTDSPEVLGAAASTLAAAVRDGRVGALTVVSVDGVPVLSAGLAANPVPVVAALTAAGFAVTPGGLRLRPRP